MKIKGGDGDGDGDGDDDQDSKYEVTVRKPAVMEALKNYMKREGYYEEDEFEDKYPHLNEALLNEGGKIMFMQKLKSISVEELVEMENDLKQVSKLQIKASKRAAKAINKLCTKWLQPPSFPPVD